MQMQVMRVLLPIGIKAMLDGTLAREAARERDRQRLLEELDRKLRGAHNKRPGRAEPRCQQCDVYGENRAARRGRGKSRTASETAPNF
jgi:hypothetical protein